MKGEIVYPSISEIEGTNRAAVHLFGTDVDEDQAQPTLENALALIGLDKNTFICLKDEGKIVAWSVVLPTSREDMNDFLSGKITERELFDRSVSSPSYEALYLTAVVVLPEHRKQGIGLRLMKHQIEYFRQKYGIADFYAYTLNEDGKRFAHNLERELKIAIPFLTKV